MIHVNPCRRACAAFALVACGFLAGCQVASAESLNESCRALGLCDEPPKPPVAVDLLCDASVGSSCDRESLEETLRLVLASLAERPGSELRFWALGKNVAETENVGEQVVPAYPRSSEKARTAHEKRFADSAQAFLLASAGRIFQQPRVRRSPIAEALAKIALNDAAALPRTLIVISDARDVSAAYDFECGSLPTEGRFLASLKRRNLLTPGSLSGMKVEFAFVRSASIPGRGCAVDVDREVRIRALWLAALRAAGASEVHLTSGAPVVDDDATAGTGGKEQERERHQ